MCTYVFIAAALVLGLATACAGPDNGETGPSESMATIEEVLREHTDSIMSLPGVVGVGQGECSGDPCIRVFVLEKTSELMRQVPSEIGGFEVEVHETGDIEALDAE